MKKRSVTELQSVVRAGGIVTVDAAHFSVTDFVSIGQSGANSGGGLQILNCDKLTTTDLVKISSAAPGRVTFT